MKTRLDGLQESQLVTRIQALDTNITDLKNSQYAGSANMITERALSGAVPDFAASVVYQTTTAYELTINARDSTFAENPFIWQVFWDVVNSPATTGFLEVTEASVPANGQAKYRLYLWGTDAAHLPETLDIVVVIYGLNIGTFSVVQII